MIAVAGGEVPASGFTSILIDPPWPEHGGGGRGAQNHYRLTKVHELPALICSLPLWRPNPSGCSVWLWTTTTHLMDAGVVLTALGARYVTKWTWCKAGKPGLGQRSRATDETLLLGIIGRVPVPPPAQRLKSWFVAERPTIPGTRRPRHSAKPPYQYQIIESHDPPGPRAELFCRDPHPGWWVCGDQMGATRE